MDANEWKREEKRLAGILSTLQVRIAELEPEAEGLRDQAADIQKRFWDEVTVNTSSDEDLEETFYTVRQQAAVLNERERRHRQLMQQWQGMNRLLQSPYFGRIDFREDGLNMLEEIYIGVSSLMDDDGLTFLIYDWRSPIAGMYYDYSPGTAAYDTPIGPVSGEMELKRQFRIQGGQLRGMFDAGVTIGDELLQEALSESADSQMKSIVATIQREQNAIIRDDASRMLIVQGAAGSGKTSAALQRAAYLLYKHRERLKADQILLFSPNPMFNSYVSTVLPELGEENLQQTTFQEYLDYSLEPELRAEDPFDQIEYVLSQTGEAGYEARMNGIRYKASPKYLEALQRYAEWLGKQGMRFRSIRLRERELISAGRMEEQFYRIDPSVTLPNRIDLLREWLLGELARHARRELLEEWVQEELNYLDKEQYAEAFEELHKDRGVFDFGEKYEQVAELVTGKRRGDEADFEFADREEELLRKRVVKDAYRPLRRSVRKLAFVDMPAVYAQLFDSGETYRDMTGSGAEELPGRWAEIGGQTKRKLAAKELYYEDATPFLYLKELVEGVRTNAEVRHVFIDEGQDYSMFQYEYVKKLFPRARMTVLGDFGQAIFTQSTDLRDEQSPLLQLYGKEETRLIRLLRSYRSTREIVAFTRTLLPDGGEIEPFERSGKQPLLVETDTGEERLARMAADLEALRGEGFDTIAVIAKTASESLEAYEALQVRGCRGLKLITKKTPAFEKGIMVIPAYLAKGVEFDAVLVYDASERVYGRESERKLFYTACTRAMHRLHLYADGEWTPFLRGADFTLYEIAR
ncbi:AAA family ATPase [Paenibacillus sp. J5C_2022]|uniref:RNA polymerase recycling motor HelD n=1 Tax=Paenibacillus sp. J5C2022 TaxID=2977129 RepID=UPI0021D01CFE|nr:RNA polymerase recycling motor HelD [Paenibacillus sp. J5C2022]MCU6707960.1 AAA family ATPase [Paenibacillus sp. J5C2022]